MSAPEIPLPTRRPSLFEGVASFAIIAALLYFGAGIFVPLVLAILLAFALTPVVNLLSRRAHLPDALAVILAVLLALSALLGFSVVAGSQIVKLAQELPGYQETISSKISGLQDQFAGLTFLDQINNTITALADHFGTGGDTVQRPGAPLPVTISNDIGPLGLLTSVLGSIIGPVATVAIVAVFLIFLLIGRTDLQDRFIRLVSAGRYSLTTIAITDASSRVGRYLIVQLMVNVVYGTIFGLGLWLIGVPSALLWGLLIVLFRYIPFVGALIIAVVPFLLAFAVDPGWNMLIYSVALFLVLDLTTANIIEPRLYGSSTGVSPIAILLSAMFWATLWGPVGLILATPMTVCLVVIGRHLPQLHFLETVLGSEPVLTVTERLYHRMLKGDAEGAMELADEYVEEHSVDDFAKDVMLPTLQLAETERSDDAEALPQRRQFVQTFDAVVRELASPEHPETAEVVIIGGRTELDECAASLLGLRLSELGEPSRVLPPVAIRQEAIGRLDLDAVETVVLVFLGRDIRASSRYASRRIRRMKPDIRIVVCALHADNAADRAEQLYVDALHHDMETTSEALAVRSRKQDREDKLEAGLVPAFVGAGRGNDALGAELERIAERFSVPVATINLLDDDRHIADEDAFRLTRHIAETRRPLVIRHDHPDPVLGDNAYIQTNSIGLYVGVPLILEDGQCAGALVLIDYEAARFDNARLRQLQQEADALVSKFTQLPALTGSRPEAKAS